MNTTTNNATRSIRHTLGLAVLAAPLAAAITVGAGVAAHADGGADGQPILTTVVAVNGGDLNPDLPAGPGDLTIEPCAELELCPPPVDPEDPELNPAIPEGPGDLEVETPCWQTDTCPPPEDPELNPDIPPGPGDLTTETPCWQTDTCPPGDDGDDEGTEEPTEEPTDEPTDEPDGAGSGSDDGSTGGFDKPTRIDAGSASDDGGLELAWLLPGGLLVAAGGMAFASRRLRGEPR